MESEEIPPPPSAMNVSTQQSRTPHRNVNMSGDDPRRHLLPAIYAVPTSETFDDASVIHRSSFSALQASLHSYSSHQIPAHTSPTPPKMTKRSTSDATANRHRSRSPQSTRKMQSPSRSPMVTEKRNHIHQQQHRHKKQPSTSPRGFQFEQDLPSASVKTVNMEIRSAFGLNPVPSVAEWKEMADRSAEARKSSHMYRRMSPSLQHLELIQILQSQKTVRQLYFSPSCGLDADPFIGQEAGFGRDRPPSRGRRDGRYRPVDIVQAYISSLPSTAPILSHKKMRLPTRADVGFPFATEEEIISKQKEISHETEWEEATPRLVVLITSTDLGTTVEDESWARDSLSPQHMAWNGGGLEGMPFCGKDLIRAFEQNAMQWGRSSTGLGSHLQSNPYSILAPPLDAIYSRSQGWRARPFHDRPPGMEYVAVCPTNISYPVGNIEPLLCSLALYSLPVSGTKLKGEVYGKMSEDFWFPAGKWNGKVDLNIARKQDGSLNSGIVSSWLSRKHKAVFSYNAMDAGRYDINSLFVVLKVYKVAQHMPTENYSSQRSRSKQNLDIDGNKAEVVYDQFGMQLVSPISFGVASLCDESIPKSTMDRWPRGTIRELDLLPYPTHDESQEDFINRLVHVLSDKELSSKQSQHGEAIHKDGNAGKRNRVGRMFRSPMKVRVSKTEKSPQPSTTQSSDPVSPRALLFISSLGVDFLECLLSEPDELVVKAKQSPTTELPKLLVDPTGDGAVILRSESSPSIHHKRSHLVRMPNVSIPADYLQAAEFREVMPLPARGERQHDLDAPLPFRSLANLLYVSPRSLRLHGHAADSKGLSSFTVRLRLVQNDYIVDKDTGDTFSTVKSKDSVYCLSPWTGCTLVDAAYTAISNSLGAGEGVPDFRQGVPLMDEIKIRLPRLIDGSYGLEFALFSVEANADSGVDLRKVADATIPLSSSGTRDAGSGSKVATIIPNGNHRVKMGDFQLQVETRLISSLHVPDPSVAVALREFPFARSNASEEQSVVGSSAGPWKSMSHDLSIDLKDKFPDLLSTASPSTIRAHFPVLLHMHLANLVLLHEKMYDGQTPGTGFQMGTMLSLFEMMRKARSSFSSSDAGISQLQFHIKRSIDAFDERALSNSVKDGEIHDDDASVHHDTDLDPIPSGEEEHVEEEVAVNLKSRMKHSKNYEARVSKITSELGAAGVPLSRSAYGATKIDRMRLEGEILGGEHLDQFFEDDETVATMSTFHIMNDTVREISQPQSARDNFQKDSYTIEQKPTSAQKETERETEPSIHTENEFAQRVKTAAQVMLAPCVGPALANIILAPTNPSPRAVDVDGSKSIEQKKPDDRPREETPKSPLRNLDVISQSGSDLDGIEEILSDHPFRGATDSPTLFFSASRGSESDFLVACGGFLYETLMLLWLRAWLDHIEDGIEDSGSVDNKITSFVILPDSVNTKQAQPIFSFFANMDFLLPLCIKSLVLRYSIEISPAYPLATKVLLDEGHLRVLEPFVEMLARGLMGNALAGLHSEETLDQSLLRSLQSSDVVNDFFAGLNSILHGEHMHSLISKYFRTFRDCETEHLGDISAMDFQWTEENLHRVRSSRQLRLQAIERFATLPSFLALNHPRKYEGKVSNNRPAKSNWLNQYVGGDNEDGWNPQQDNETDKLPPSGWLSGLLTREALSICALSSESVVAEAMAHVEVTSASSKGQIASSLKKRPGAALKRADLLMFQSLSTQAITSVYELIIRRHTMDRRFQAETGRGRIAGMLAIPIFEKSIQSIRWLARMEATHRVRSTWLLCLIYILQEAPEHLISSIVRSYCDPREFKIHKFLRLLRLCTSSFQSFLDRPLDSKLSPDLDKGLSAWLLQESFNTVCVATNVVVEVCVCAPHEERKMLQGLLDLLLHILTTPQSSVTHLRAVGGALQTLEKFGVELFIEITGTNLQHWVRVVLSLMNSISMAVRSIAVDFLVSLVGKIYDEYGNLSEIALTIASVLPEVAARESKSARPSSCQELHVAHYVSVAMFSVHDHINCFDDVAKAVWPLRRSLVDLDGNPLDDDRIDPQLSPILSGLCRACQAIIDGVMIELRLKGNRFLFPDKKVLSNDATLVFDADEESLYEAASFFLPETGPMQRIRWFMTLRLVHEKQGQFLEAAEALIMCSRTILDSVRHLKYVWRPSKFLLWTDSRRSHWLDSVGEESNQPDRGNAAVIDFADEFLEPITTVSDSKKALVAHKLQQPTASAMCDLLCSFVKEAVQLYLREGGMEEQAFSRLEMLQRTAMNVLEDQSFGPRMPFRGAAARKRFEEDAALRKAMVSLGVEITGLTERMHLDEPSLMGPGRNLLRKQAVYAFLRLSGKKPPRFEESVALPCFLEWREISVCRISQWVVENEEVSSVQGICSRFAQPLLDLLKKECGDDKVKLVTEHIGNGQPEQVEDDITYLHCYPAIGTSGSVQNRRFCSDQSQQLGCIVDTALFFPCPLSRQRSVLTTEIAPMQGPVGSA